MRKILVLGGTGFLGKAFIDSVSGTDDLFFVITRNRDLADYGNVRYLCADIENVDSVEKIFKEIVECEVLIDMAALMPGKSSEVEGLADLDKYFSVNVQSRFRLLNFAFSNLKRIVFVGSIDVYGKSVDGVYREDICPAPLTNYGLSKLAAEDFYRMYADIKGVELIILRPSQVYGVGDSPKKVIPIFIEKILNDLPIKLIGGGESVRTYLNLRDFVAALILAMNSHVCGVFNVAGGEQVAVRQLVDYVEKLSGKKAIVEELEGAVDRQVVDISKATSVLRFVPKVMMEEGLKEILNNQ